MNSDNKAEHHEAIRGAVGHYGLSSSELELKTPLPLHLDHTHSVYVAVGTLISAIIIVAIAVIRLERRGLCGFFNQFDWIPDFDGRILINDCTSLSLLIGDYVLL